MDKPLEWTSFDVVNKVRNLIGRKTKVGHAGTLDPLATGLLILCTGKKTKQIEAIQAGEKEYLATVRFGATTASYDAEEPEENPIDATHLSAAAVEDALSLFTGELQQRPPAFSAVKVKGKRAYALARQGQAPEVPPRTVHIHALELVSFASPRQVVLRVVCGKGTYIRSLAHDLGQHLGVGAYLGALRRTRIGTHLVEDALTPEAFAERLGRATQQTNP